MDCVADVRAGWGPLGFIQGMFDEGLLYLQDFGIRMFRFQAQRGFHSFKLRVVVRGYVRIYNMLLSGQLEEIGTDCLRSRVWVSGYTV